MRSLHASFAITADNQLEGLAEVRFCLGDVLQVYQGIKAFYKSVVFAE